MLRISFKILLFISLLLGSIDGVCQVPYPKWANDLGGISGDSKVTGLKVDNENNVYITGYFKGNIDLDPTAGVSNFVAVGDADIYIAKYNSSGGLLWAKAIGGSGLDQPNSLTVDNNGNVTVIGQFTSSSMDADPGSGVSTIINAGGDDIFIIQLDKNGQFLWAKAIGSSNSDRGADVAADKDGNLIAASFFSGDLAVGAKSFTAKGDYDGLLVKYNPAGNVIWAFSLGSSALDQIRGVEIDANDNILISGSCGGGINFNPLGTNAPNNQSGIFVAKYSAAGNLAWVKTAQGGVVAGQSLVTVDSKNNVYISGAFSGSVNFGSTNLNAIGSQDIFIAKFTSTGDFLFGKDVGGAGSAFVYRFTSDADNNIYCTGYFSGQLDFNPDPQAQGLISSNGPRDLYLAKYDENGNYKWAFSAGNAGCDNTYGIEVDIDKNKNVLLGGAFCSTVDFDPSLCAVKNLTAKNGTSDSFIAQYSQDAANLSAPKITSFSIPQQTGPAVIDAATANITVTVPMGTNITALMPQVVVSNGAVLTPSSGMAQNFSQPINYVVTNNCLPVTYTVTVKVESTVPVINKSACPSDAVLLNSDVLAIPPDNYSWQVMQAGIWVNAAGVINQANYTTTAPANLTGANIILDYRRAVTKGGNTVYDSFYRLTVTPSTDQSTISVDRQVACGTVTKLYNFTGNRPVGYTALTKYQWQTSTDGINWQDEANVTGESWGLSAQITVKTWFRRVTITGNCKAYSNVISIDHIPGPGPATVGPPVTLCNVTEYTLTGNIPAADETGSWSVISATGYNPFTPANIHDPQAHITGLPLNSGFDFTWTLSKTSCDQIYSASVYIKNGVTSTITDFFVPEQDAPAVIDQTNRIITLSVSPKVDRSHLMGLVTVDNGTVSPASGTTQDFTGVVNYRLTDQCSFVDYKVTVNQATLNIIHVCQSENNVLLPATGVFGATYQWEKYLSGVWQPAAGNNTGADYIAAFTGSPSVTAIDSYRRKTTAGGIITYEFYYDVYFDPSVSNNQIVADNTLICQVGTQLVNLTGNTASAAGGNITYQWRISTDNAGWQNVNNATQKNYQFVFSGTVTKYYSRVATSGGCSVVSNIIRIDYAGSVTNADAGMPQSVCNQPQLTLNANTPKPFEVGTWSVVSPAGYNPFNNENLNIPNAVISDLPYDVDIKLKWTIEQPACGQSSENIVTMRNYSQPVVNAGSSVTIDRGGGTILNGSVSAGNYTYMWSPITGLNDPGVLNPVASPGETTVYTLTAKNGLDCIQQATVKIIVNNDLGIPSTITPNDDGINDTWTIKNIDDHAGVEVQIFDRAGRPVFYSKGYGKKWDATYNGKKLPAAVYYYIIRLNDIKVIKKGWITVIY